MQELVLITETDTIIQGSDNRNYTDSRENFEKDFGEEFPYKSVDYNRTIGSCCIDGKAFQDYPNTEFEGILDNVQTYIDAKKKREKDAIPDPMPEEIEAARLEKAKAERATAVAAIKVEVDGMTFDGDEKAQSRMTRAIQTAEITGMDSTQWVLADNSIATVTVAQMKQALAKAMTAMGKLWTKPYELRL